MMSILRVGSESGGSAAAKAVGPFHDALNNCLFFKQGLGPYFKTLDFFVLALRVSGKAKDFKMEGPDALRKERGMNYYGIDLVIPQERWVGRSFNEVRLYVLNGVRLCFELCIEKAKKSGELVDETKLRDDFEIGICEILDAQESDDLFNKSIGLDILHSMIADCEKLGIPIEREVLMKRMEAGIFTV